MNLLIVSATAREIQTVLEQLGLPGNQPAGTIRQVEMNGHKLDFLITGVGTPLTLLHLGLAVRVQNPDLIINVGIAGSYREEYPPGTTALIVQEAFGDLGISLGGVFHSLEAKGLNPQDMFPFKQGCIDLPVPQLPPAWLPFKRLKGLTVNAIGAGITDRSLFVYSYEPDLETMEGAAVALFCAQYHIPCLALRTVSNRTIDSDSSHWNLKPVLGKLDTALLLLLKNLSTLQKILP